MDGRDAAMIDALRRAHEAFNRGDFDAAVQLAHPEVGAWQLQRGSGPL
jgi:hypothetical protein